MVIHHTISDDDVPKGWYFLYNSLMMNKFRTMRKVGCMFTTTWIPPLMSAYSSTLRIFISFILKVRLFIFSLFSGKSTDGVLTRRKLKEGLLLVQHQALLSFIYNIFELNHKDSAGTCLFACFLSQEEPKKVSQALADESWVEAMQEELLQFQNEVLNKQRYLSDKTCIGFGVESSSGMTDSLYLNFQKTKGFHSVPPPTGTIIPPRANVSFTGIDELAIRNKVVNQENTKSSQPEIDRNKVIIEDWIDSDDEETVLHFSEIQKKTILNSENSETSFENRTPKSQDSVGQGSRKKGLGDKGGKTCFVCYSPDHLIKDYNLHERTFKKTQTHKPKGTQGSRDTRPVWNNINRVNHSNFSGNSRYPHQKMSYIPSAVLTREGLKSIARPKITQTVPSKSTAKVFYQGTARPRVPQVVLLQSTGST
ncbi:hypothetical protein Tco_1135427 [Tanacetum coccineum]